jgi:hypothetical protein
MKTAKLEVNDNQYQALQKAKKHWGRTWKSKLRECWKNGIYPASLRDCKAELQQVRNEGGPTWLQKFRFNA